MNFEAMVINSGIFKLGWSVPNPKKWELSEIPDLPGGVYKLTGPRANKSLSKSSLVPNVDISVLLSELKGILYSYIPATGKLKKTLLDGTLNEIEDGLGRVLYNFQFTKEEALRNVRTITRKKNFEKLVSKKFPEKNLKYWWLILPLYHTFQKHLQRNQTDTFFYIAHFLVGCGIEKEPVKGAYERIQIMRKRIESGNGTGKTGKKEVNEYAKYRNQPEEFDTVPPSE